MVRVIKYLWASPVTVCGLLLAAVASMTGGAVGCAHGVVEVYGGVIAGILKGNRWFHGGAAMTLGHVILARTADCLAKSRQHEMGHVRQFERWGLLLPPLYWMTGLWLRLRGYDPYLDNPFESISDDSEGGDSSHVRGQDDHPRGN